ncbi:hypothetical protein JOH51_003379 [Rhizobium leguminosarum]|nr:hypothetical protein [Rhizobium leguminosarum]
MYATKIPSRLDGRLIEPRLSSSSGIEPRLLFYPSKLSTLIGKSKHDTARFLAAAVL